MKYFLGFIALGAILVAIIILPLLDQVSATMPPVEAECQLVDLGYQQPQNWCTLPDGARCVILGNSIGCYWPGQDGDQ